MSTLSCRFCEHRNPSGAKYCNECGSPLGLKPCPNCEALSDANAEQCHQCNLPFGATPVPEPTVQAADAAREPLHIPESLAPRLDRGGLPHSHDEVAEPHGLPLSQDKVAEPHGLPFSHDEVVEPHVAPAFETSAAPAESQESFPTIDPDRHVHRNRYVEGSRSAFRRAALAVALIAVAVAGYYAYTGAAPEFRPGGDVALAGRNTDDVVPASATREAGTRDAEGKSTTAEPRAAAPSGTVPATATQAGAPPIAPGTEAQRAPAVEPSPPPKPVETESVAAAAAPKQGPKIAQADPKSRARKQPNASAVATQRLIERDLAAFVRKDASGATGGASPSLQ